MIDIYRWYGFCNVGAGPLLHLSGLWRFWQWEVSQVQPPTFDSCLITSSSHVFTNPESTNLQTFRGLLSCRKTKQRKFDEKKLYFQESWKHVMRMTLICSLTGWHRLCPHKQKTPFLEHQWHFPIERDIVCFLVEVPKIKKTF